MQFGYLSLTYSQLSLERVCGTLDGGAPDVSPDNHRRTPCEREISPKEDDFKRKPKTGGSSARVHKTHILLDSNSNSHESKSRTLSEHPNPQSNPPTPVERVDGSPQLVLLRNLLSKLFRAKTMRFAKVSREGDGFPGGTGSASPASSGSPCCHEFVLCCCRY